MTPEEFTSSFQKGWTATKPDGFIAHFLPLCHPDVVVDQPLLPTARGPEAYMAGFRRLFALLPDLQAEVQRSAVTEDTVFIESRVTATLGGRPFSFDVADRFTFEDGLIVRRVAYFDPAPILKAVALRPWSLGRVLKSLRG